jgi:hypothetical protein
MFDINKNNKYKRKNNKKICLTFTQNSIFFQGGAGADL